MNFLKISGLVIGAGSVVGGTGAGIYYGAIKNTKEAKPETEADQNPKFTGKLVFKKKSGSENDSNYEIKLLSKEEYDAEVSTFDANASDKSKYVDINKIVDISSSLNAENTKTELEKIFVKPLTLESIKSKITSEATKLKELFNDDIYTKLENIN